MVLVCSRVFPSWILPQIWYLSLQDSKYRKWYVCFDCLDGLFAMVCFDWSLEVPLYCEILNILQNKWEHQNSWNLLESNPTTIFCEWFHINLCNSWWLNLGFKEHQQVPPHLTFASPWAKPNSTMDQELLQCFHASKVHMCSIKNSPLD
jgi:hypothetical protein